MLIDKYFCYQIEKQGTVIIVNLEQHINQKDSVRQLKIYTKDSDKMILDKISLNSLQAVKTRKGNEEVDLYDHLL